MPDPTRWRSTRPGETHIRHWDADYVVYNPLSGSTHFFDELTGQLLVAIVAGTVTQEQLLALAGSALGIPDDAFPLEDLRERLSILFDLGLIEPAEPC